MAAPARGRRGSECRAVSGIGPANRLILQAGSGDSSRRGWATRDLTKQYDYGRLIEEEKDHYSRIEVTSDLKEGGVHASSAWQHYWEGVARIIGPTDFGDLAGYVSRRFASLQRPIEVLSLGSGYAGNELALARGMRHPYRIRCTDINEVLFERARAVAREERLCLEFGTADLNFLALDPGRFDLIFAHAVIHHVINVEHLFSQLVQGLSPEGVLHLVDVVGKNRKLIWDESERFANALLDLLPTGLVGGVRLAVREEDAGMEGIRQEEILPHLRSSFVPLFEHRHGAFMRFICTHPQLGAALDPRDARARQYLDFLIESDDCAVRHGVLRPLEIWGVYRPRVRGPDPG